MPDMFVNIEEQHIKQPLIDCISTDSSPSQVRREYLQNFHSVD